MSIYCKVTIGRVSYCAPLFECHYSGTQLFLAGEQRHRSAQLPPRISAGKLASGPALGNSSKVLFGSASDLGRILRFTERFKIGILLFHINADVKALSIHSTFRIASEHCLWPGHLTACCTLNIAPVLGLQALASPCLHTIFQNHKRPSHRTARRTMRT
jgi:hypothetical protein